MTVEEFRERWANEREPFIHGKDNKVRAWTGKNSEGYRVLTALMKAMEDE